jgi:hypothetical protein
MQLNLSKQDIDYIARVAETEVDHGLKSRNPAMYDQMTAGVIDTIINRVVSDRYPNSVSGVVNQRRQFSKITGPKNLKPYGSVERTPKAGSAFQSKVENYIQQRAAGMPSSVGGHLNYANPHYSTKNNLGWINKLDGPKFGQGRSIHHHGTTSGYNPVGDYSINLGNSSPAFAYNEQSLPSPSKAPVPDTSSGLFQPANLFTAPRGQVQIESLGPANPSPITPAPSGNVIRAGSLPKATPPTEANPKAALLQAAYQKRNVPTPAPRPADLSKAYTPKASDYSNYMMNVKQPTLPTGSAIPTPAMRPADLTPAPVIDGPVGKPLELVPEKPTRIQQAKTKVGNHLKEQLKPQTIAARGAGALIGGLLGGPLGAKAGSMFGPQIAQRLNGNRQQGLFGGLFNQNNQAPMQTGAKMGSSSSEWGSAQNKGATYSASDGASITGLGNGTYSRTNPITGKSSQWNSDGSRSTKGY